MIVSLFRLALYSSAFLVLSSWTALTMVNSAALRLRCMLDAHVRQKYVCLLLLSTCALLLLIELALDKPRSYYQVAGDVFIVSPDILFYGKMKLAGPELDAVQKVHHLLLLVSN